MTHQAIVLTPEQQKVVDAQCPPSVEYAVKNAKENSDRRYTVAGIVAGGGMGAIFGRSLPLTFSGVIVGGFAGKAYGYFDGKSEGQKLIEAGDKQPDKSCVYEISSKFSSLNEASEKLKQAEITQEQRMQEAITAAKASKETWLRTPREELQKAQEAAAKIGMAASSAPMASASASTPTAPPPSLKASEPSSDAKKAGKVGATRRVFW